MRKGSFLPRYTCWNCGKEWARGGKYRWCPKCSARGPHLHLLSQYFDEVVRSFDETSEEKYCPRCGGLGFISRKPFMESLDTDVTPISIPCPNCRGTGK